MRRYHHVAETEQLRIEWQRFNFGDVDRRSKSGVFRKMLDQRILPDDGSPRRVHDRRVRFHERELGSTNKPSRSIVEWTVDCNDVRSSEQRVERRAFNTMSGKRRVRDIRIECQHARSEPPNASGRRLADRAKSDNADRQLPKRRNRTAQYAGRRSSISSPRTFAEIVVEFHDATVQREDKCQRMIGDFIRAIFGEVGDHDSIVCRGGKVDIVQPDAIPSDNLHPGYR